eukprot:scaffold124140_cov33-Tisochrysis_lutea.AAC.3
MPAPRLMLCVAVATDNWIPTARRSVRNTASSLRLFHRNAINQGEVHYRLVGYAATCCRCDKIASASALAGDEPWPAVTWLGPIAT